MYKIIGADQREYGPVSADEIRQWIAEGRANAATLAQAEGSTDWNPLSSFPDFDEVLAGGAPSPPLPGPAPAPVPADPTALVSYVRTHDYDLDIGRCLTRSWMLFKENFGVFIPATIILLVVIVGFNQVISLFTRNSIQSLVEGNIDVGAILLLVLWNLPEMALSTLLTAGLYWLILKRIRGQQAGIGDLFEGFRSRPGQLALAGIVIQLLTMVGFLACILPGIYLSVAWVLSVPLIIDRRFEFWTAMEVSRQVITQHWWLMFCLVLVVALVTMVGFLACCIGLVAALPIGLGALMYAYEDIFGGPGTTPY